MSLLWVTNATPPLSVPPKFCYLDFAFLVWYSKPASISCSVYFSFIFEKQGRRDLAYSHILPQQLVPSTSYSRSLATLLLFLVVQHAGPSRAPQQQLEIAIGPNQSTMTMATGWALHLKTIKHTHILAEIRKYEKKGHILLPRNNWIFWIFGFPW